MNATHPSEQELAASSQATLLGFDPIAGALAQDLDESLSHLQGHVTRARQGRGEPGKVNHHLAQVEIAAKQAAELVDQLRLHSKSLRFDLHNPENEMDSFELPSHQVGMKLLRSFLIALIFASSWLALGSGDVVLAETPDKGKPAETISESPLQERGSGPSAARFRDRLQVHGHLSVAYAERRNADTSRLFAEEQLLGISDKGGFDHVLAALQIRYDARPGQTFVLQWSHRSLGDSVLDAETRDVELDWLFWKWQVSDNTHLKIGRFPTPAGIFNEIRDVGTLLPFFRPAFTFYREGGIFSETADGVGVWSYRPLGRGFSLESAAYVGLFDVYEQDQGFVSERDAIAQVAVPRALGGQLWLETPMEGLRLGAGAMVWDVDGKSQFNPVETRWKSWYLSVDGSFERFTARAEYRRLELPVDVGLVFSDGEALVDLYYWQLGWHPVPRLGIYVQSEYADFEQRHPTIVGGGFRYNNRRDDGVAVHFDLLRRLVLRGEYHEQRFDQVSVSPVATPDGLAFAASTREYASDYLILSFAVSF